MKVKLDISKCIGIILANLCHPYVLSTTVLSDTTCEFLIVNFSVSLSQTILCHSQFTWWDSCGTVHFRHTVISSSPVSVSVQLPVLWTYIRYCHI